MPVLNVNVPFWFLQGEWRKCVNSVSPPLPSSLHTVRLKHPLWNSANPSGLERMLGNLSSKCGGAALSCPTFSRTCPCCLQVTRGPEHSLNGSEDLANHSVKCFCTKEGFWRHGVPSVMTKSRLWSACPQLRGSSPSRLGGMNVLARNCWAWTLSDKGLYLSYGQRSQDKGLWGQTRAPWGQGFEAIQ